MNSSTSTLYHQRLSRYLTAMRNEKPDCVPIRPFVAEFTAKYAGMSCQQVTHDYNQAFEAVRHCAHDFDWDAIVSNMVYVWTGLTQAIGIRYYGTPGIDVPSNVGFQYLEPPEGEGFMREDEYDELIDDPTAFLYNKWLPRVSTRIAPIGTPSTFESNLALVKGAMAMNSYFNAFGEQNRRLKEECGTVSAISGIFKAPFDILADKLRGYIGLTMDMFSQPKKVLKACEALMPHLYNIAAGSADPMRQVPIGYWMHRGCIPFVSAGQFESHYFPTVKPIIEELWKEGKQTLFYAEGNWGHHLESLLELPEQSLVFHVDMGDLFDTHRRIGHRFCLSGGVPNTLMSYGKPTEIRDCVKRIMKDVAPDGGYIMDCSAIIQNDAEVENIRLLTQYTRELGVYSQGSSPLLPDVNQPVKSRFAPERPDEGMETILAENPKVGVCVPFGSHREEFTRGDGDPQLIQTIWNDIEGMGNSFIWQCLLSF